MRFKNEKWQKVISHLKRTANRKTKYKVFDINKYVVNCFISFKKYPKQKINTHKRFNLLYGYRRKKQHKKFVKVFLKKSYIQKTRVYKNSLFLSYFEKRLDIVLYKSYFCPSVSNAKQLILHNFIKVNNKVINNERYILQIGDIITIKNKAKNLILKYLTHSAIFYPFPPNYLKINYKTLQILLQKDFKKQNLSLNYPFWLDVNRTIRSYKI